MKLYPEYYSMAPPRLREAFAKREKNRHDINTGYIILSHDQMN